MYQATAPGERIPKHFGFFEVSAGDNEGLAEAGRAIQKHARKPCLRDKEMSVYRFEPADGVHTEITGEVLGA